MWISIIIGSIIGVGLGFVLPTVPYVASKYLAIAIIAALDTVLGGIANNFDNKFDSKVFISGFFMNAIMAILLTYLGQKLNVDIYLAALIVFVGRIFNNIGIIRRYYINKISSKSNTKAQENQVKTGE